MKKKTCRISFRVAEVVHGNGGITKRRDEPMRGQNQKRDFCSRQNQFPESPAIADAPGEIPEERCEWDVRSSGQETTFHSPAVVLRLLICPPAGSSNFWRTGPVRSRLQPYNSDFRIHRTTRCERGLD
jgi:hypothetical protein